MKEKEVLSSDEIETVITHSPFHEWPELYTTDKHMMKRYEKFMNKHPDHCKLLKEDAYSMTFAVAPKCVGLYPRAPRTSHFTEEQITANAERLRAARKTKSS